MLNNYLVTLKSGIVCDVQREEPEGKNVVGLWNWSLGRKQDIVVDFINCSILSSEIAMIEKPANLKGEDHFEEEAKDNREDVQEPGNMAAEPYDYNCYE